MEPFRVVWPEAAPGLSVLVSKEVLCSEGKTCAPRVLVGFAGLVFIESLCTNPVGFGWDTPICMVGSRSRGTAEPDPTAKTVTALTRGLRHSLTPPAKTA